jgi:ATP-dependent Zn protease
MILACDKRKNVAVLNPSRLDKWISNDNTDINKRKNICIHKCIYI